MERGRVRASARGQPRSRVKTDFQRCCACSSPTGKVVIAIARPAPRRQQCCGLCWGRESCRDLLKATRAVLNLDKPRWHKRQDRRQPRCSSVCGADWNNGDNTRNDQSEDSREQRTTRRTHRVTPRVSVATVSCIDPQTMRDGQPRSGQNVRRLCTIQPYSGNGHHEGANVAESSRASSR